LCRSRGSGTRQQIVSALDERGITVARRTIVKYRDAQKIPSSNRRRR
jgi:DNA-directed RNA polymerase specialized sigma54-like protein